MKVIEVNGLKKYFGPTKAVDDISFGVEEGEIFGFLGPNGAGKTTTIRCLMDFIRPDLGTVKIFGAPVQENSAELRKEIGFLPGEVNFYPNWTGRDHITLLEKIRGLDFDDGELIRQFSFNPQQKVKDLSTGNKQKLGLILALLHQPKLLILDEPTLGLDPLLQNTVHEIVKSKANQGKTVLMSSHNLSEVEKLCHRVCVIKQGKIVTVESIPELKKKKLYTIYAHFQGIVPRDEILVDGVEVIKEWSDGMVLSVKEDINPLLSKLGRYRLKDLEVVHASLEEVFMEFYQS